MRFNKKRILLFLLAIILFFGSTISVNAALGKKTYAKNKYIWIYVNGERMILPSGYGYPCYGQGTDNKNILYIPLSVLADMNGCEVSPLRKQLGGDGKYTYSAEVTGEYNFTVNLYSDEIDGIRLAGETFILKGTDAATTNVIMVPLGFAKDYFGLQTEVKRPVGRGVYDYCSLAINITGETINSEDTLLKPPVSDENESNEDNEGGDTLYFVHAQDTHYHLSTCSSLVNDTLRAQLSEYECLYWGYTKCPLCLGTSSLNVQTYQAINDEPEEIENQEESDDENYENEESDDNEEFADFQNNEIVED